VLGREKKVKMTSPGLHLNGSKMPEHSKKLQGREKEENTPKGKGSDWGRGSNLLDNVKRTTGTLERSQEDRNKLPLVRQGKGSRDGKRGVG